MRFNGKLAWGNKVSPQFRNKILEVGDLFSWNEDQLNWLMACIAFESGETFDPAIQNAAGSGAIGIIQFMPSTAEGLGTSSGELVRMTAVRQLDYVVKYFQPYHKRVKTLSDMYMAILLPSYIGKPEDSTLFSGGVSYRQNSGLDTNKDGKVTKQEASSKVYQKLEKGLREGYFYDYGEGIKETQDSVPSVATEVPSPPPTIEQNPAPVEERTIPVSKENIVSEETKPSPVTQDMASTVSTVGKSLGSLIAIANPIVGAVFTAISGAIPELKKLYDGNTPVSERNIGTVAKVVEIAQVALGASNEQEVAERVIASPQDAEIVKKAITDNWFSIVEFGGGVAGAYSRNKETMESGKKLRNNPAFIVSMLLTIFPLMVVTDMLFFHASQYTEEIRAVVVNATMMIISSVMGFWIGTSYSSQGKTDLLMKK